MRRELEGVRGCQAAWSHSTLPFPPSSPLQSFWKTPDAESWIKQGDLSLPTGAVKEAVQKGHSGSRLEPELAFPPCFTKQEELYLGCGEGICPWGPIPK